MTVFKTDFINMLKGAIMSTFGNKVKNRYRRWKREPNEKF